MQIAQDVRTAPQVTAQARAAAALFLAQFSIARYLPSVDNYSLGYNFQVNDLALADAAEFRSWNTSTDMGRTEGGHAVSGKLPPIGRKYRVDEKEQLDLYVQSDALGLKYDEYAQRGGIAIAARIVKAQAEGIEFGRLTLEENKLHLSVNYGRVGTHTITVGTLHSSIASDPLADMMSARAVYRLTNGVNPAVHKVSTKILEAWAKSTKIIQAVYPTSATLPSRVSQADVLSVFASEGIYNIEVDDTAIDGVRLFSENAVIFLPDSGTTVLKEGPLGTTEWGITAESIRPAYSIAANERPGIFAGVFDSTDPEGSYVNSSAVVIPAIRNANATLRLQVLA